MNSIYERIKNSLCVFLGRGVSKSCKNIMGNLKMTPQVLVANQVQMQSAKRFMVL